LKDVIPICHLIYFLFKVKCRYLLKKKLYNIDNANHFICKRGNELMVSLFFHIWCLVGCGIFFLFFSCRQYFSSTSSCIGMHGFTFDTQVKTKITHSHYNWLWSKAKYFYIWLGWCASLAYLYIQSFLYYFIWSSIMFTDV